MEANIFSTVVLILVEFKSGHLIRIWLSGHQRGTNGGGSKINRITTQENINEYLNHVAIQLQFM